MKQVRGLAGPLPVGAADQQGAPVSRPQRARRVLGAGEGVGVGTGLDDGVVEGEVVDDGRAEAGVGERLVQPPNDSLEALAMLFVSSRSVRTWARSSAPRRSRSG